jgi:hypothetical protein
VGLRSRAPSPRGKRRDCKGLRDQTPRSPLYSYWSARGDRELGACHGHVRSRLHRADRPLIAASSSILVEPAPPRDPNNPDRVRDPCHSVGIEHSGEPREARGEYHGTDIHCSELSRDALHVSFGSWAAQKLRPRLSPMLPSQQTLAAMPGRALPCQEETFRHSLRVTGARKYQRSDSDYRVPRDRDELVTSAGLLHMTEGRE